MANKRTPMRKIKEIFRLKSMGLRNRKIARSLNISHSTVGEILRRAEIKKLGWEDLKDCNETEVDNLFYLPQAAANDERPMPDLPWTHKELKRKGVTLQLLWAEYKEQNPSGYERSYFCELYSQWKKKLDLSMRQHHKAGEKTFVDFAGLKVGIVNKKTGEVTDHPLFVGVLGASNYTYAELCEGEDLHSWTRAHVNMFNYFGGVSEIIVPDNLKSGVKSPCRYEPEINPTYFELANHYDTVVIPARVRKPKDKAKAETGVLISERWILAALRNRTFFSIAEANEAIFELLEKLNTRPFKKLPGCRRSLFEEIEKSTLKPLPLRTYEFANWKKCTVNIDYHVEVDGHYYSVHHSLVREKVEARYSSTMVEIHYKGKRVAIHIRSFKKGGHTTNPDHMPAAHRKYLEWSPSRIISWAKKTGPFTGDLVKKILESRSHPEQGYRSCIGIIRLGKKYGPERLENAAQRALHVRALSYKSVNSILSKGLDKVAFQRQVAPREPISHDNLWGKDYFH